MNWYANVALKDLKRIIALQKQFVPNLALGKTPPPKRQQQAFPRPILTSPVPCALVSPHGVGANVGVVSCRWISRLHPGQLGAWSCRVGCHIWMCHMDSCHVCSCTSTMLMSSWKSAWGPCPVRGRFVCKHHAASRKALQEPRNDQSH